MKSRNPKMLNGFLGATQLIGENTGSRIRLFHFDAWTSQWDAVFWWTCLHESDPDVVHKHFKNYFEGKIEYGYYFYWFWYWFLF